MENSYKGWERNRLLEIDVQNQKDWECIGTSHGENTDN